MVKKNKLALSVLSTAVAASVIAVPTFVGAEETSTLKLEKVVISKDGKEYVLSPIDYARAVTGRASEELNTLVQGSTVSAVKVGDKYIQPIGYAQIVRGDGVITEEELSNITAYDTTNVVEQNTDGEWVPVTPVDPTPEENLIETFFYNLAA